MGMSLRPYQQEARQAIESEWTEGRRKTLLVLPTGTGKTVVFSMVAKDDVDKGGRVLILAHRGELLQQAADKLASATGLGCSVEKAEQSCLGEWYRVVVGSVQTLMREKRLKQFPSDYFTTVVVDEAHHALSDSYQLVLNHFTDANILGVTATPDRGDRRNLGAYFDSIAYEYTLPRAIKDGYLCPIKAQTVPLKLDLSGVKIQSGDYSASDLGTALDPYLDQIADEMVTAGCLDRKTVVFLPLVATSKKFRGILASRGFQAAEVNGESIDRAEVLEDFDAGHTNVLCNSMLLTEGWDCPSVDCIVVLRPTKVRSLYCLDDVTEILTETGWKRDVSLGEMVATFNVEDGTISYKPAIATVRRPLDEDEFFCSIAGPQIDIRVTNKHRMVYDNKRKLGWKFKEADQLADLSDGAYIPVSGHGRFGGVPLTDDELRFIGWVLSDGTMNQANGQITITQGKHQPWLEKIQDCIDGCGFKHNRFERSHKGFAENSPSVVWTVCKGQPRGRDKHLRGWGDLEPYMSKQIPTSLFDMTESQFDVMLEAIHLGDGAKQLGQTWTRRSYHISTGDRIYAERLQIMAIQRGWKANISIQKSESGNDCYILHMKKKDRACIGSTYDGRPTWNKEQHTEEQCWCVQTDTGTIVTRRNGKVAIMGNCQMVGRGTRLSPETGKTELLLLDFLWHTERHELCHPAHLIAESDDVAMQMTANMEDAAGCPVDLEEAEQQATSDVLQQREEALAEELKAMRNRKRKLVDPLQFEMSIAAEDLTNYVPAFGFEMAPASDKQLAALEKFGIFPDTVECAGKASLLLDKLHKRKEEGLSTPKQIRFLESKGFKRVGTWEFSEASNLITRISANGWRVPRGINPSDFSPEKGRQPMPTSTTFPNRMEGAIDSAAPTYGALKLGKTVSYE